MEALIFDVLDRCGNNDGDKVSLMEGEMYLWAAAYHLPVQSERETPYLKPVFTYYQFNINSQEVDAVTDERAHIK